MKVILSLCVLCLVSGFANGQTKPPTESAMSRFLRYVKIDTQSAEDQPAPPSTKKQLDLARLLETELKDLSVQKVRISEWGIVYGLVPGNLADNSSVPTIGFMAHMDTSPAVSGMNVNAIIHKNYQGGDIVLPNDKTKVITVAQNPDLKNLIGGQRPPIAINPNAQIDLRPCHRPRPDPAPRSRLHDDRLKGEP